MDYSMLGCILRFFCLRELPRFCCGLWAMKEALEPREVSGIKDLVLVGGSGLTIGVIGCFNMPRPPKGSKN